MALKKILVAIDGSEITEKVVAQAANIAKGNPEAEIKIITVMPIIILAAGAAVTLPDDVIAEMEEENQIVLNDAVAQLKDISNTVTTELIEHTEIARSIIEASEDCDLIVIGNRGLGGVRGYLGSVSLKVLNGVNCSVCIVK